MHPILKFLEQTFFPYLCAICHHKTNTNLELCQKCNPLLPWAEDRCFRCGTRISGLALSYHCEKCWNHPPAFDRLYTLFDYELPVSSLISSLKFHQKLSYGKLLGTLLFEQIKIWYRKNALPQAIIPIPLHAKRLRWRGFNQSLELLRPCKKLEIPILNQVCIRKRFTRPQAGLKGEQRRINLRNAFEIAQPFPYKHVAILDDVVTTGSTVQALSQALKKAGVEWIDIWCICKV